MFHLREFATALPLFNRLAITLAEADPTRWKSLLRDLQCRTALGHPPQEIIKVIQQQKHLYPKMGGAVLEAKFMKLQRDNERRAHGGF